MLRFVSPILALASVLASGCGDGTAPPAGTPVAAEDFCEQLAQILCTADRNCCPSSSTGADADADADDGADGDDEAGEAGDTGGSDGAGDAGDAGGSDGPPDGRDAGGSDAGDDCVSEQLDQCRRIVEPLLTDPRTGYDELGAGAYLAQVRSNAEACWPDPVTYADFAAIFRGTGAEDSDCTPRDTSAGELRLAALSCLHGSACHLYLRADGESWGVCEPREDSGCSHAFDCPAGQWCNLPADWRPGVWGECQPLRTDGWGCGGDLECASQYCDPTGTCATPAVERYCLLSSYATVVRSDGPIGYWRLGDRPGATAYDSSGGGLDGTYRGGMSHLRPGALADDGDAAARFDGTDDAVAVPAAPDLDARSAITMECWFNPDDVAATRPLLEYNDGTDFGPHVWNFDAGDKVYANFIDEDGGEHAAMSAAGAVAAGSWHHVAATYDGATGRLYLNGTEVGSVAGSFALRTDVDFFVGARASTNDTFLGGIDEVALYDHALPAARVTAHYQTGANGPSPNAWVLFRWLE